MRRTFRLLSLIFPVLGAISSAGCVVATTRNQPIVEDDGMKGRRHTEGTAIHYEHSGDSPEISRSVGTPGGVVILWPRILPRTEDPHIIDLATRIQARLERLAGKASSSVDRRPMPERVCPKGEGCRATSLGAVIAVKEKGCAVVAVVGPPGTKDLSLVPLAGDVKLTAETAPFREPPENNVTVTEFVPCDKLFSDLESNVTLAGEDKVAKALETARGQK